MYILSSMYRFHTKRNTVICSDPDNNWAKKVMKIVDGRLTTKPSPNTMCYTRTTNVIPTKATTDETSGTETEPSTSITVTPAVMTIKTSETETSTSTTVTPAVTTIKTSETETSTSTTVTPAVTTIKTSETETSKSTTVQTTVTTTKTSTPETEVSKTTIQPTSVSTDNPESTAITCGKDETTETTTLTTTTTTTTGVSSTTKKKKLSKMMIRKSGKSKKGLRRVQMRISLNSASGHLNKTKPSI